MNNSINTSIVNSQYEKIRKEIAQQDIYRAFALNANSLKPELPKGYLLKNRNPLSGLVIATADTGTDVIELTKALAKGQSNDNQLGRFNDLGMKLGGLGIASYLFTRRGTGTKGLMEFLGCGAFFASMAMWPKVLIAEPLKHRFGFDIRQKYVDSQGRKKLFFQDNQYQPWDMWNDEQIDKVADKMGISKDVKDRRELTKEKMRTLALQGNTLWMLTAGFSPLLTSMICNVAEKGVTKVVVNNQMNNIVKNIDNINGLSLIKAQDPSFDASGIKNMKTLLARYSDIQPDDLFFRNAAQLIDPFRVIRESKDFDNANIVAEMRAFAPSIEQNISSSFNNAKRVQKLDFDKLMEQIEDAVALSPMGRKRKELKNGNAPKEVLSKIKEHFADLEKLDPSQRKITLEQLDDALKTLDSKSLPESMAKKIQESALKFAQKTSLDDEVLKTQYDGVQRLYDNSRLISAKFAQMFEFLNNSIGQKFESATTSVHFNSLNAFMHELNPSYADLKEASKSASASQKYLQKTLTSIAQNDGSYAAYVKGLSEKQSKFEAKIFDKIIQKVKDFADTAFDDLSVTTKDTGLKKLLTAITAEGKTERGSLYRRALDVFAEEKLAGVKATNHWQLIVADLERKISSGEFAKQWTSENLKGSKDSVEQGIKMAREIAYNCSMNALSNKFYEAGNGEDAIRAIKILFHESMDEATVKNCDEILKDALETTRNNIYKLYGQITDLARKGHRVPEGMTSVQKSQYSMVGKSISELVKETADKQFNDKRWMKMFGGLSLAVLGVTLISQLFFGKVKDEHLYKKQNQQKQGGVNAAK